MVPASPDDHAVRVEFVVTGVGRSGTKYVSRALTAAGAPTGHECAFRPRGAPAGRDCPEGMVGEVSWLAVPHLPLDVPTVHAHREPLAVITSMARRPLKLERAWGRYFLHYFDPPSLEPRELAVWRYAAFTRISLQHASLTVRVEDGVQAIARIAEWAGYAPNVEAARQVPTTVNKHHKEPPLDWGDLPAGPDLDYAREIHEALYT